ncbi:pilus assembly protein [Microlunatus elymi]|uniref:Pilus assembly protein n=1 Tax=Microlunatus elymi TaxID=2596828 RepID=A0A516PU87_9ACTN|nr:TadE family protein [Microlunatus elymi]QDP94712.1 pilus assembly protein [Microlunatus elymi]
MINTAPNTASPDKTIVAAGRALRAGSDQRGLSPAIELVILAPALMILLGLVVAGARIWFVRSTLTEAAYSGARAASIQRSIDSAAEAATAAADAQLQTDGVDCAQRRISFDLGGFRAPVGQPAAVTGVVRCRVEFGDVLLPGFPGSLWLTGRSSAVIDTYRER